jgi:hypothetical protein
MSAFAEKEDRILRKCGIEGFLRGKSGRFPEVVTPSGALNPLSGRNILPRLLQEHHCLLPGTCGGDIHRVKMNTCVHEVNMGIRESGKHNKVFAIHPSQGMEIRNVRMSLPEEVKDKPIHGEHCSRNRTRLIHGLYPGVFKKDESFLHKQCLTFLSS